MTTASLLPKIAGYQAVRFPLLAYVPMVAAAAFCAVGYSFAVRDAQTGAPGVAAYVVAGFTMLGLFFLLRVLDEHKDAETDARHRPELPVPSGLVTLRELRLAAALVLGTAVVANTLLDPLLLLPLALAIGYAALMGREFFVRDWLRARPLAYLLSHMVVMPLVVLHATAVDWLAAARAMPGEIWLLLGFAFLNGLVIEIGRKLRGPAEERAGVETYTASWGVPVAASAWAGALAAAAVMLWLCADALGAALPALLIGAPLLGVTLLPAHRLVRRSRGASADAGSGPERLGKAVETMAGVWVLGSYLLLGTLAFLARMPGGHHG